MGREQRGKKGGSNWGRIKSFRWKEWGGYFTTTNTDSWTRTWLHQAVGWTRHNVALRTENNWKHSTTQHQMQVSLVLPDLLCNSRLPLFIKFISLLLNSYFLFFLDPFWYKNIEGIPDCICVTVVFYDGWNIRQNVFFLPIEINGKCYTSGET